MTPALAPAGAAPVGGGSAGRIDRSLLRATAAARPAVGATAAIGLAGTLATAAQAILLGRLVAGAFAHAGIDAAPWFVWGGLAVTIGVRAGCGLLAEIAGRRGAGRVKAELRAALVGEALARADPIGPGELATLAGRGLDALDAYVGRFLPDLVLAGAAPAVLLVVLGLTDWLSALVVIVAVALFPVFGTLVGWATAQRARARWAEVSALGEHLVDLFEGLPVLRAYGRAPGERARIAVMGERVRVASRSTLRLGFLSGLVLDTLASVATALVAVPIGLRLLSGSMRLSAGLTALLLTPEVFLPLRRASAEFHESAEGRAAAARVLDLLCLRPPGTAATPPATAPAVPAPGRAPATARHAARATAGRRPPAVSLRGVSARRPGRALPVLEGASLEIGAGETVVLVGPNGAGKSTVVALLLGLVRPEDGAVLVDGEDLAGLDSRAWRRQCSTLGDRPTLLPGSLAENLRLADADADEARLLGALADAACGGLVASLPGGLDTPVGDGGWPLSGGERQRVALARALVRDAACVLLDEPTAHLDPATEAAVVERLRGRLAGASALVVTHRPAVVALGDRVVALRRGRLVEVDPADALRPAVRRPTRTFPASDALGDPGGAARGVVA